MPAQVLRGSTCFYSVCLLISTFPLAAAIDCYRCPNSVTSRCGDPFEATWQEVCSGAIACLKITGRQNDMKATARTCWYTNLGNIPKCEEVYNAKTGLRLTTCICEDNLCNGATSSVVTADAANAHRLLLIFVVQFLAAASL